MRHRPFVCDDLPRQIDQPSKMTKVNLFKLQCFILIIFLVASHFHRSNQISTSELSWLIRTWACQAEYQSELVAAQTNNEKAMVMAPKNVVSILIMFNLF